MKGLDDGEDGLNDEAFEQAMASGTGPRAKRSRKAKPAAPVRAPLAIGDEAWVLLQKPVGDNAKGNNRATLTGCAKVRVEAVDGDRFDVVILLSSGHRLVGSRDTFMRAALYACTDRDEKAAFRAQVERFWGPASHRSAS